LLTLWWKVGRNGSLWVIIVVLGFGVNK
jgi:hypothetical protein